MIAQALAGAGLPQDRLARIAARQAFVDLKHDFMFAVAGLPGEHGAWLRGRIRRAEDLAALHQVRNALFAALPADDPDACTVRHSLQTSLDSLFCDSLDPGRAASAASLDRQAAPGRSQAA